MNILISGTESHPVNSSAFTLNKEDKRAIVVYGLAKKRGDNIVASSRISDSLFTVLSGHTPRLTYYEVPELDPVQPQDETKERLAGFGIRADFVGIAYNIRKTLTRETYEKLLKDIGKAIE